MVKVTVKILGTRCCFDTGSTLTGTATTEFVPIGAYAVGLNVKTYGQNRFLAFLCSVANLLSIFRM